MTPGARLHLHLRRQALSRDERHRAFWQPVTDERIIEGPEAAILICDMWDRHWCRGASERVAEMAPRMDGVVRAARAKGVHVIHAPSETMQHYEGAPARLNMLAAPQVPPPEPHHRPDPPLPIDDSDEGSDTGETEPHCPWSRQHPAIHIDDAHDAISDSGEEIYSFIRWTGIRWVIMMGVHTNMCVLSRSFGIKQLVRWGINTVLVRDLTDAMYNPARPPYVSHEEGTRLVVEYIEKFWCPTIPSEDLA